MAAPHHSEKVEPVLYLLFGGMVFFTAILLGVEEYFNNDSQIFQVIAGVLTGFTGAFFGRIKPAAQSKSGDSEVAKQVVTVESKPDAV